MCIIITKEKGAKPLPKEVFENCWDHNPDGAGILYHDGSCSTLIKGIMKREDFLKKAKEANQKENSFIIHTRIATHGSVKPENTHPFVSKSLGFAHNGTLPVEVEKDMTDSETFFLGTIADKSFEWVQDNIFLLNLATRGSRCAVFNMNTGEIIHLNEEDWVKDEKYPGVMFSGKSYSYKAYDYKSLGVQRYNGYKGYKGYSYDDYSFLDDLDDDDFDEYDWNKSYTQNIEKKKQKQMAFQYFPNTKMGGIKVSNGGLYLDYTTVCKYLPKQMPFPASVDARDFKENILKTWDDLYEDAKAYYDDDYTYIQAIKIIKLFYGIAYANGYYHVNEVDKKLDEFLKGLNITTLEEDNLVREIRFQVGLTADKGDKDGKSDKKAK